MTSEDKFRELLRQKLDEKEFPFNPAKWEKAKDLIDASREKKKRRSAMILWSLLLLLTLGSSVLLLNLPEKAGKAVATAPAAQPKVNVEAPALSRAEPKKTTIAASQTPEAVRPDQTVIRHAPVSPQHPAAAENIIITAAVAAPVETKRPASSNAAITAGKAETPAPGIAKTTRQQPDVSVAAGASEPAKNPTVNTPPEPKEVAVSRDIQAEDQAQPPVNVEPPATSETAPIQPTALAEETPVATPETPVAEIPSVALKDTAAAAPASTEAAIIQEPVWLKHAFFAEAGINGLLGWQTPQKRDAQGINPVVGLGYTHFFSHDKGLSFGIQYTNVSHLGAYSHTSTVTRMGFGEEKTHTVITPTKLHYLAFPIRLQVNMDDNNTFGLGYTLAWLLTADGRKDVYEQQVNYLSYEQPVSYTSQSTSKVRGYTRGFSSFDSQLSVFYRRKLYKDLSANAEFLFGLTDVKDNTFFGANTFERTMGLKITLIYNLFKK